MKMVASLIPRRPAWRNPWLYVIVGVAFAEMTWLSLARYYGYNLQSFDLGNISQAIWSATQGSPLLYTTDGISLSRLAWHVELFYFLLTPLYALCQSPISLLVFQSMLYALGAFPLYRLAHDHLSGSRWAILLTIIYLFYPVAQTAVLFQFHGDTLAMPMLLWALEAADRRAWRAYALWLMLALSLKFYVAVPVATLSLVLWRRGERRAGVWTGLLALTWGLATVLIVRPIFASQVSEPVVSSILDYLSYYFTRPDQLGAEILLRGVNAVIVFGPILLLIRKAPIWLLPAAAIAVPALLSTGPGPAYDYRYHHYALTVPFLVVGSIYGAGRMREKPPTKGRAPAWQNRIWLSLILVLVFNAALVDTPLNPRFYGSVFNEGTGLKSTGYGISSRDQLKDTWLLQKIPGEVPVAADDLLGSRLVNRPVLYRTHPQFRPFSELVEEVEYVAVDALYDFVIGTEEDIHAGGITSELDTISLLLTQPGFALLESRDGLLLFGKGNTGLAQQVDTSYREAPSSLYATFNDTIGLVKAEINSLDDERLQLEFEWMAMRSLEGSPPLVAVSRLEGFPDARIVHLPTMALLPTNEWIPNQIVNERFEFALPAESLAGSYPLFVGWYDTSNLFAAETDARSRVGNEVQIGWLEIRSSGDISVRPK
jgi:uncharacterized membrane protein